MNASWSSLVLAALALGAAPHALAQDDAPALPDYAVVPGISGTITSVGSDTLANLMTLWSEEFQRLYPAVNVQIQASGSSTAPPSLTEGTSNVDPMSRLMKTTEIESFEDRFGYKPTPVAVAIDALSVYVHKDNPIEGLSFRQLDAIFSATRRCGAPGEITRWGQLGLGGDWAQREIQVFGRNSVSGTYGHFKDNALCGGDYKNSVNEQPGSASVVQAVATSLGAIGYSGIGYRTPSVRAVPIARNDEGPFVEPTPEATLSGQYPLARLLYIYLNRPPGEDLPPLTTEFLKLALSRQGQALVERQGFIPLPPAVALRELEKVEPAATPEETPAP